MISIPERKVGRQHEARLSRMHAVRRDCGGARVRHSRGPRSGWLASGSAWSARKRSGGSGRTGHSARLPYVQQRQLRFPYHPRKMATLSGLRHGVCVHSAGLVRAWRPQSKRCIFFLAEPSGLAIARPPHVRANRSDSCSQPGLSDGAWALRSSPVPVLSKPRRGSADTQLLWALRCQHPLSALVTALRISSMVIWLSWFASPASHVVTGALPRAMFTIVSSSSMVT